MAIGAAVIYGERLTSNRIALIVLGMVGVGLAVGSPAGATPAGVLFGLGAGIGCTTVVLGNHQLLRRGLTVPQIAAVSYLTPATTFVVLSLAGWVPAPPGTVDAWAPALAYLGATIIPWWLFYTAVSRIGAPLASLLATLEPLVGVLLAWLLIGEPLGFGQVGGGALILSAVTALGLEGRDRREISPVTAPATRSSA